MKYVHILIISSLFLCSCLFEEEAELGNESLSSPSIVAVSSSSLVEPAEPSLPSSSSVAVSSSSSPNVESSSSSYLQQTCTPPVFETASSANPDPLILECPPEDIAEFPILDIPDDWCRTAPWGGCAFKLKTSKEELSFNAQGGVRCITTDRFFGLFGGYDSDNHSMVNCTREDEIEELKAPPSVSYWKTLKCPSEYSWITATVVDTRILHISVNKNETGSERKLYIHPNCQTSFSITQSAE